MLNDKEKVAKFFLSLDKQRKYFNKNLITKNNRNFYEGNARLNKLMHLAQNIYYAMTEELLINADFYAYDNGAVIPEIQENYGRLIAAKNEDDFDFSDEEKLFLTKIFVVFKDAPLNELIEIDHEDPEWRKKHSAYSKLEQKMDIIPNLDDYKKRYKDIIIIMNKMEVESYIDEC